MEPLILITLIILLIITYLTLTIWLIHKLSKIKKAVKESERRREIQLAFNKKHKIIPKSIIKEIREFE